MIELYFTIIVMIAAAITAISLKGLLSSIIALGVVGQALLLVFIFLKAPELAIAHLVIEIVVMAVLIRATMRRDTTTMDTPTEYFPAAAGIFFIGAFIFIGYLAVKDLPAFGEPIMRVSTAYIRNCVENTGALNVISGIVLDYRILDTMVLVAAMFGAVIAVYAVMRKTGRIKKEDKQ